MIECGILHHIVGLGEVMFKYVYDNPNVMIVMQENIKENFEYGFSRSKPKRKKVAYATSTYLFVFERICFVSYVLICDIFYQNVYPSSYQVKN